MSKYCDFTVIRLPNGLYKHSAPCGTVRVSVGSTYTKVCAKDCESAKSVGPETKNWVALVRMVEPDEGYGLGDITEATLTAVGITKERVVSWLGSCGGCDQRKAFLNRVRLGKRIKRMVSRYKK